MRIAARTGPIRSAVRRNVSVLANPAASRDGSVACLTTAKVAPRPNDFHACASTSPTKIQIHGSIVTPATVTAPTFGAISQTTKPTVETSPKAVSAYRDPMRSDIAPPGYGYTAEMTLPKVPNNPTTNPDAPSATMYLREEPARHLEPEAEREHRQRDHQHVTL